MGSRFRGNDGGGREWNDGKKERGMTAERSKGMTVKKKRRMRARWVENGFPLSRE